MIKYLNDLKNHEKIINNYINLIENEDNNNKVNELLLKRFHFIKSVSTKYYYPNQIYYFIKDFLKNNEYKVKEDELIKCLNDFKRINNYHYSYWEIEETLPVVYNLLLEHLSEIITIEPGQIIKYNSRKEKKIYNILNSIDYIDKKNIEKILNNVYDVDKTLLDITEYKMLDISTRNKYRQVIIENSKKENTHEYLYTKKLIKKVYRNHKPIANFLFKRKNYKGISNVLLIISIILSIIISILINKHIIITCFLLILFIYNILIRLIKNDYMPEYYYNRIPETSRVMLVKYVVLKDKEDVSKAFGDLEKIYLNHREDAIDYTLLIDTTDSDHQIEPFDNEITDNAISYTLGLNERFGKDKFHVIYRKRVNHKGNWHGLNRKEGAIRLFNKLLLNELSKEELDRNFMCNSDVNKEYKYVVEINDDENDINIRELVGMMEHPYNQPVIKNKKVLRGYIGITNNGRNILGDSLYSGSGIYRLQEYNELLDDTNTCLLHTALPRMYSLNNDNKQVYNHESLMKNNINLINNGYYLNYIQTRKRNLFLLSMIKDLLVMILLITSLIFKDYYYLLLLLIIGNIPTLFMNNIFNIKLVLGYIFSKKYRMNILEHTKKYNLINIIFVISLVILIIYRFAEGYNLLTTSINI